MFDLTNPAVPQSFLNLNLTYFLHKKYNLKSGHLTRLGTIPDKAQRVFFGILHKMKKPIMVLHEL